MYYAFASLAAFAGLALAVPQGVTSAISPSTTAPAGCSANYDGSFQISVVKVDGSAKAKRDDSPEGELVITLNNGILMDQDGRTGYIAANNQFQFDKPAQTGAIYTAGWSVCSNGTLAIGSDVVFKGCLSGTFYNLYDENDAAQCVNVFIEAIRHSGSGSSASASATGSQASDGQPGQSTLATSYATPSSSSASPPCVTQISDGQPQACTPAAGMPQPPTSAAPTTPVASTSAVTTQGVATQISDGQPQAPTNGTTVVSPSPSATRFTGGAVLPSARVELFGLAAGLLAVAAL